MWPKTTLLPVWLRDTKVWDTPGTLKNFWFDYDYMQTSYKQYYMFLSFAQRNCVCVCTYMYSRSK